MEELKPCPFCGGEARLRRYPFCNIIQCENEDCHVKPSVSVANDIERYGNQISLIEAWNTRAERTCNMVPNGEHGYAAVLACSACGNTESVYAISADDFNYCPNCGAKVVQDAD